VGWLLSDMENQVRAILNDRIQENGSYRYSSQDLYDAFNDALQQARYKRPDAFLSLGLRNTLPQYQAATDGAVPFPIEAVYFPAFVFYVTGRTEMREDTFADDKRAPMLLQKFTQMLLQVAA
jgi:hypothetical protein